MRARFAGGAICFLMSRQYGSGAHVCYAASSAGVRGPFCAIGEAAGAGRPRERNRPLRDYWAA